MMRLSAQDISFILRVLDLQPDLRHRLETAQRDDGILSDEDADELRDACGEYLQTHGFDADYRPTEEGRLLEILIDKLFIG